MSHFRLAIFDWRLNDRHGVRECARVRVRGCSTRSLAHWLTGLLRNPKSKIRNPKSERASVLIVSAGVLAVLALMALSFAAIARLEFSASRVSLDDSQAVLLARAALDYALHVLRVDKYGTDNMPYNRNNTGWDFGTALDPRTDSAGQDQPSTITNIVAGYWIYHKDEAFDALCEEWMPDGGQFGVTGDEAGVTNDANYGPLGSTVLGVDTDNADGDSNPGTGRDAFWKNFPLANGLMGQYAIYIVDFGGSRLDVNTTTNTDDRTTVPYSYRYAGVKSLTTDQRPLSSFDIRLQDLLAAYFGGQAQGDARAQDVVRGKSGTLCGRYGDNQLVNNLLDTNPVARATEFYSLNPGGDDKPYGAETAAELAYPTPGFNSRLEDILGLAHGSALTYLLTPWSFDTIENSTDGTYRTNITTTGAAALSTALQQYLGLSSATANQLAANIADYQDADNIITQVGSAYGLEAHPYITETYYQAIMTGPNAGTWQYRIEIWNPFDVDVNVAGWSLTWTGGYPNSATLGALTVAAGAYALLGYDVRDPLIPVSLAPIPDLIVPAMMIYGYQPAPSASSAHVNLAIQLREPTWNVVIDYAQPSRAASANNKFTSNLDATMKSRERIFYYKEDMEDATLDGNWQDTAAGGGHTLRDMPNPNTGICKPLVVANRDIYSLGELGNMLTVGYTPDTDSDPSNDPYTRKSSFITSPPDSDADKLNLFTSASAAAMDNFIAPIQDPRLGSYDRDGDGTNNDPGTQAGDIGGPEIQVPGLININTASEQVLAALPRPDWETPNAWASRSVAAALLYTGYTLPQAIIRHREGLTQGTPAPDYAGPFHTVGDILGVPGIRPRDATDPPADATDRDLDGLTLANAADKKERDVLIKAVQPLITTRSNTFTIFVVARVVDPVLGNTLAQRRLMAIVDRSVDPIAIRYFKWLND